MPRTYFRPSWRSMSGYLSRASSTMSSGPKVYLYELSSVASEELSVADSNKIVHCHDLSFSLFRDQLGGWEEGKQWGKEKSTAPGLRVQDTSPSPFQQWVLRQSNEPISVMGKDDHYTCQPQCNTRSNGGCRSFDPAVPMTMQVRSPLHENSDNARTASDWTGMQTRLTKACMISHIKQVSEQLLLLGNCQRDGITSNLAFPRVPLACNNY